MKKLVCFLNRKCFIGFLFGPIFIFLFALEASAICLNLSGLVVDNKGAPIKNAIVRLQGTNVSTLSDNKGHFLLNIPSQCKSKHITAWKKGFYNGGKLLSTEYSEYRIVLTPIAFDDNKKYHWLPSIAQTLPSYENPLPEGKPCQNCHPSIIDEWKKDAHSASATNSLFLAFFNGTDAAGKKDVGPGYKSDFPNSNGNCAKCHIPALALRQPLNANPNTAQGVEKEGVSCDFCHKIRDVKIDKQGNRPGVSSIQFLRPSKGHQIFYGPYDDVFPGEDSYHPLYKKSDYCAPCHHGRFWNVLAYSEFQEWAESSYAKENIHCQHCHMKPDGKTNRFALEKEGGIQREPSTIFSHVNFGVKDKEFMMEAIKLETEGDLKEDGLHVSVTVKNVKAGHHYPTGNPMRNMILLVEVWDDKGQALSLVKGEKVPSWGGIGSKENGGYAELPGKGFAKVLKTVLLYPDKRRKQHFPYEYPASHWRPTLIESDNRIPANGTDVSSYHFHVPKGLSGPIQVDTKLIYRRAYKKWLDVKLLQISDMVIAENTLTIRR